MIFHNQDTGIPFPSDLASKNFPQLYLFSSASTSMFNIFIILKRILKFAGFVVSLEHSLLTEKNLHPVASFGLRKYKNSRILFLYFIVSQISGRWKGWEELGPRTAKLALQFV